MSTPARLFTEERLATIVLDDAERRNVLSTSMFDALDSALEESASASVIRIRATGPAFCAGFDLRECAGNQEVLVEFVRRLGRIVQNLRRTPAVVVAEVQGPALAGGCALVSASDIALASQRATFGYPVHRIGISPAVSLPTLLDSAELGAARALALSGESIDAREAFDCGLIHALHEPTELTEGADALCAKLLTYPADILATTKKSFDELGDLADDDSLQRSLAATSATAFSEEAARMLAAFWAKKAPS